MINKIKFISLIVIILISCQLSGKDILANTSWKCNGSAFEDSERESYTLTKNNDDDTNFQYGYSISFGDGTFSTSYSAPCGNDCFPSTYGTYKFINDFTIEIYVDSISRSGYCQLESEEPKRSYGLYKLTIKPESIIIDKIKSKK